jgi:RNA binding exosome subunit
MHISGIGAHISRIGAHMSRIGAHMSRSKCNDGQISEPINTNKGVRRGCGLSPDLLYIYINKAMKEWKQTTQSGIQLRSGKIIQTILYADDQVITAESEDELQIVNELDKIVKKYGTKISTTKTKTTGLCGKNIQRVKIEIEGKMIEQVSSFNYLGNLISNEEKDINIKLQRYNKMNGIIKCNFAKHMTMDTKLRIHNITSKAALCYGSEV